MKFIPTVQRERAQTMRNLPTIAERKVWHRLRGSQLDGIKFSRQIAIGPFIADFVARSRLLVVEIDGSQHGGPRDVARQTYIEAKGFQVLRFGNQEVSENIDGVVRAIWEAARVRPELRRAERVKVAPPTPPVPGGGQGGPLPAGEEESLA